MPLHQCFPRSYLPFFSSATKMTVLQTLLCHSALYRAREMEEIVTILQLFYNIVSTCKVKGWAMTKVQMQLPAPHIPFSACPHTARCFDFEKKKSHLNIYVLETSHLPRNESWFALHNAECNLIPPTGEVCCIAQTPVWWTSHLSRWHVHTMCTCKPHLSSQEEIHSIKT